MEQNKQGVRAYISLGSNIGDREQSLREAIEQLHALSSLEVISCSSMYETDPVGYVDQPSFINMVAAVQTTYSPQALLEAMLRVELELGRVRHFQNGPRTIDLDLLLYDQVTLSTSNLTLPHPRMYERAFVLVPLAELMAIMQDSQIVKINELIHGRVGKDGVSLWKPVDWRRELGHFEN